MREIRTSGLMSGDGKRGGAVAPVLAPILDSTGILRRAPTLHTLIRNRSLRRRIDDQYFQRRFARFQFESQRPQALEERLIRRALQQPHDLRGKVHRSEEHTSEL